MKDQNDIFRDQTFTEQDKLDIQNAADQAALNKISEITAGPSIPIRGAEHLLIAPVLKEKVTETKINFSVPDKYLLPLAIIVAAFAIAVALKGDE